MSNPRPTSIRIFLAEGRLPCHRMNCFTQLQ